MEEKIFTRLTEALGKTGFSERTLRTKARLLAKKITSEEEISDELIDDAVEELKEMEGQLNHEIATKVKEQTKKTGKKPEQKPNDPTLEETPEREGNDDFATKILARLEALEAERAKEKEEINKAALEKSIIEKLKSKGATNETLLKAALYEAKINYDKTADENVEAIRKAYDAEASKIPEVLPFFGGGGGGGLNEAEREAERKARKEKILQDRRI